MGPSENQNTLGSRVPFGTQTIIITV
jgi:hypothetical protein